MIDFPIPMTKMSGTGNDFIVIDHRQPVIPQDRQQDFVAKVCRRRFSVGADGVILIEDSDQADFSWRFYNSDGSVAEMCGNGARCAARFAYRNGIAPRKMTFETLAGMIQAEIIGENEEVKLLMTDPFDFKLDFTLELEGREQEFSFVNTGVPHVVCFVDLEEFPIKKWGREIRFHEMFQPAGTNVNFVRKLDDGSLQVRTYERGVEDETMACGTGAVAAALIACIKDRVASPVAIVTSGGDCLTILIDRLEEEAATGVYLQGPAHLIYSGELTAESLL